MTIENFDDLINSNTPVLVDFFATWCGPCKMMSPILDEVSNELDSSAKIVKIDVDQNMDLSSKYGIRGVPTLILFKKGEIVWRHSGILQPKDIKQKIIGVM